MVKIDDFTNKTITVQAQSFEDFIKQHRIKRIDFLKMDCERSEYKIFKTISSNSWKKMQKISMEYHNMDNIHIVQLLKKILIKQGFKVKYITNPWMLYAEK